MSKTNANAPTQKTDKKQSSKKAAQELTKANATKAAKDVTQERLTKYIYPENVKTGAEKKEYRRKMRAQFASYKKKLSSLEKSKEAGAEKELKTVSKDFEQFKAAHYNAAALN
jgi:hypothetical protein